MTTVVALDIDADGDLDVVAAETNKLTWYENDCAVPTAAPTSAPTQHPTRTPTAVPTATPSFKPTYSPEPTREPTRSPTKKVVFYGIIDYGSPLPVASAAGVAQTVPVDLDADGDVDVLAAIGGSSPAVRWYENDGAQSFTDKAIATGVGDEVNDVYAFDVDGDDDLDVLSAAADGSVAWYENDGAAATCADAPSSCVFPFKFYGVSYSECARVGMEGTGDRGYYWCATQVDGSGVYVDGNSLRCDGCPAAQAFSAAKTLSSRRRRLQAASDARAVVAADMDNDGETDVVVATYSNGIEYYRNNGGGDSFTQQADVDGCSGCSVAYVTSLAVADLDGDAYLDVVVGQGPGVGTSVHFFENEGVSRTFTKRGDMSPSGVSFYPAAISVGDVDKDDDVDVVAIADGSIYWFKNGGSFGFTAVEVATEAALNSGTSVYAGDVNGDGALDVVAASSAGAGTITLYKNDGPWSGTPARSAGTQWVATTIDAAATGVASVSLKDMNEDGDVDVVAALQGSGEIKWYDNDGSVGDPSPRPTIMKAPTPAPSPRPTEKQFHCAENAFDLTHVIDEPDSSTGYNGAYSCNSIFAIDMDGDFDLDFVAANAGDSAVAWYDNDGDEDFTKVSITDSSQANTYQAKGAKDVFAIDVDDDGDIDVLSASFDDDKITW